MPLDPQPEAEVAHRNMAFVLRLAFLTATISGKVYSDLSFVGNVSAAPAISACRNPLKVASIYAATRTYCKPQDFDASVQYYAGKCAGFGGVTMIPESEVADNLTAAALQSMRVVSKGEVPSYSKLSAPVLVSRSWFDVAFKTIDAFQFEKRIRPIYGWPKVSIQLWRYIADRMATMCLSNLPILWLFSGRNNIFIWATGWHFSTFNLFHRHIARVSMLQAAIHGISNTVFIFKTGTKLFYKLRWKELWFRYGVVAVVALGLMMLFSNHWFRHRFYDSFLLIHISLAIVAIVGIFYHTSIYMGRFDPYLWPIVALWSFERGVRLVRIVYCNLHVRFGKGGSLQRTRATVAYNEEADIISVKVLPATTLIKPAPGQHYFLYQPFRLKGWESHPFTLAYWEKSSASVHDDISLCFWIRPRDGWTRSLKKRCLRSGEPSISTTILLEGPYGKQEPLWVYDEVLLIAGGSGISAIVSYLLDHARRATAMTEDAGGRAQERLRTRRITLVWANRSANYMQQVAANELTEVLAREDVNVQFHYTTVSDSGSDSPIGCDNPPKATDETEKEDDPRERKGLEGDTEKQTVPNNQHINDPEITMKPGRPDLHFIMNQAAARAHDGGIRLAIMACGPAKMVDETREISYRCMREHGGAVQYFEEAFGW
ncbi:uncharacterized protein E0L32_006146 [Thyridium curvatum]|uniref:FAD-binding FR-type domain-containing protein n=1 Tax=Thyridium curvatum TaxID=1093900 RepID=A0A507B2W2_9PEZI|nr:uncharacterized protein E0L32_006146 [Thyridium curvatum]TPX13416.1 hypothetical protein E0L32_006146 [Thyridium curvatum]